MSQQIVKPDVCALCKPRKPKGKPALHMVGSRVAAISCLVAALAGSLPSNYVIAGEGTGEVPAGSSTQPSSFPTPTNKPPISVNVGPLVTPSGTLGTAGVMGGNERVQGGISVAGGGDHNQRSVGVGIAGKADNGAIMSGTVGGGSFDKDDIRHNVSSVGGAVYVPMENGNYVGLKANGVDVGGQECGTKSTESYNGYLKTTATTKCTQPGFQQTTIAPGVLIPTASGGMVGVHAGVTNDSTGKTDGYAHISYMNSNGGAVYATLQGNQTSVGASIDLAGFWANGLTQATGAQFQSYDAGNSSGSPEPVNPLLAVLNQMQTDTHHTIANTAQKVNDTTPTVTSTSSTVNTAAGKTEAQLTSTPLKTTGTVDGTPSGQKIVEQTGTPTTTTDSNGKTVTTTQYTVNYFQTLYKQTGLNTIPKTANLDLGGSILPEGVTIKEAQTGAPATLTIGSTTLVVTLNDGVVQQNVAVQFLASDGNKYQISVQSLKGDK